MKTGITLLLLFIITLVHLQAQKIGLLTNSPQAPVQIFSPGLVNTPGGLLVLGDTVNRHLEMDFDFLQSNLGMNSNLLRIQPFGGNLNIGDGLLFADRTNNFIGINTVNPTTELQLHGEMRMTTSGFSTSQKDKLGINGDLEQTYTVGLGWIKNPGSEGGLQDENQSSRAPLIDVYEMYYKSEGAHRWFINQLADVNSPKMILSNEGDFGVGPVDPESKFQVTNGYGASLAGKGYLQLGSTNTTNVVMDNNEIQARSNGAGSTLFLQFWGGNLSLCSASNTGVGVGNSNPSTKLHITGGVDASLASHGYLMTGAVGGPNVVMDDNEIMARSNGAEATFFIQNDAGDVLLCGLENGQVGIGISSSANLPSADYLLAVDGKIISEEVRVELSGNWPDYVFAQDYPLLPLAELQKQIQAEGHLPGIPSADVVAAEGFDLGGMQTQLLKKIEELTLYVIELNKANVELKAEVDVLKAKVKD